MKLPGETLEFKIINNVLYQSATFQTTRSLGQTAGTPFFFSRIPFKECCNGLISYYKKIILCIYTIQETKINYVMAP
jgi:hypothetical protein